MPFHWSPLDNHIHTTQGSNRSLFHYSLLIPPDKGGGAPGVVVLLCRHLESTMKIPKGCYRGGNCLNSPSGYSLAFIISDGFKNNCKYPLLVIGGGWGGAESLISHSH